MTTLEILFLPLLQSNLKSFSLKTLFQFLLSTIHGVEAEGGNFIQIFSIKTFKIPASK